MKLETLQYLMDVRGKFGAIEMTVWKTTCGLNEKGSMDNDEFEEYILHNIVCLYPDACDIPVNRVIIKVDSGPGSLNMKLISRL